MILRKSVPGPPMGIYDGHIVRFSGGFCQTFFALRTTVNSCCYNLHFLKYLSYSMTLKPSSSSGFKGNYLVVWHAL